MHSAHKDMKMYMLCNNYHGDTLSLALYPAFQSNTKKLGGAWVQGYNFLSLVLCDRGLQQYYRSAKVARSRLAYATCSFANS